MNQRNLPEFVEINGKKVSIYDFMLTPCESREDLQRWIRIFLGIDLPDCIVCEESTASPLDLVWNVYRAAKEGDFAEASQLYFASRDSMKTLSAAVAELMVLLHLRRTVTHMGAISAQADKCYDYLKQFLGLSVINRVPLLKDNKTKTELDLTSPWHIKPFFKIIICSLQGANSEHSMMHVVDEVDVVQNLKAYREAKKIPTETPDKKPSITLYISTRKSSFGLVQSEVNNAPKTGLKVRSWNIIDVTQACPKEKSRIDEGKVPQMFNQQQLTLLSEEEFNRTIPHTQYSDWEKKEDMYSGCVGCTIAPLCLGRLATKQKSTSTMLKSHNDVEKKFRESTVDDAVAQLMCLKPSTHGLVFTTFNERKSVMTPRQMWTQYTGVDPGHDVTKDELVELFERHGVPAYAGIDWGWTNPSVCLVIYIDSKDNVYVVHELAVTHTDDPEFVSIIKNTIQPRFDIQMYYPDIENPSGISLLKKAELPVSSKVDKDIHGGVQTIKKFIRVPGLNMTKFFVLDDMALRSGLLSEMNKYHFKLDQSGEIVSNDEYGDEFNHRVDGLRYVLHTIFGKRSNVVAEFIDSPTSVKGLVTNEGAYIKVPTPQELASTLGVADFVDNREYVDIKNYDRSVLAPPKSVTPTKKNDDDPEGGGHSGGGFDWSF